MKKIKKFFIKNLEDIVSLDLRALGFFRIFLGSIFLIDMLDRLKDVEIFYSDKGISVNKFDGILTNISFSLNGLNGSVEFQSLILIIGAILSIILILGFKTRIITILLWIVVVSVQNRNFIVMQGGDDYMRILLFWGMLLPIGYRFSYDYFKNKKEYDRHENKYISPVNIGLIFQVVFLYYFSAMAKDDAIWNKDFTAIYYALSLEIFVTWLGKILLSLKDLLRPLTAFVYYLELYVGALLVFPAFNWIVRTVGVILLVVLHIGIGTTLDVGPFPWITICAALALMPTDAIDLALRYLNKNKKFIRFRKYFRDSKIFVALKKLKPAEHKSTKFKLSKKLSNLSFMVGTFILSIVTFSIIFVAYIWNLNNNGNTIFIPPQVTAAFNFIRMDQVWGMFSPYPFTDDGWYVIYGQTEQGYTVSLFGEKEKTNFTSFPANYSQFFKNERWRKFMTNLYYERYARNRYELVNYYCEKWNENPANEDKLKTIQMYYMLQRTLPDFEPPKTEKLTFVDVNCA